MTRSDTQRRKVVNLGIACAPLSSDASQGLS